MKLQDLDRIEKKYEKLMDQLIETAKKQAAQNQ